MNPLGPVLREQSAKIAGLTTLLGREVDVPSLGATDRAGLLPLQPPGRVSPNGACRLIRAADGWIALNLARPEDHELVPAWLEMAVENFDWEWIEQAARERAATDLIAAGAGLGLPVAAVGEVSSEELDAPQLRLGGPGGPPTWPIKVVDLSALWAGPLCGAILAAAGAHVIKVESRRRPDPTRFHTPKLNARLNGRKALVSLDFSHQPDLARLQAAVAAADVLITSTRPRALPGLGLEPSAVFAANPGLVWVAITGYGWSDPPPGRVAFGDDAAAAGGLLRWSPGGEPQFLGDALADPVTGLAAAVGALSALKSGGGVLVDAALARSAAAAAEALKRASAG